MRKIGESILAFGILGVISFSVYGQIQQDIPNSNSEFNIESVSYSADSLRDPFESYIKQTIPIDSNSPYGAVPVENVVLPNFTIQGIFWGGVFPQAIINDKIFKINETIEGAQIKNISKSGVEFIYRNVSFNVTVKAADNTTTPTSYSSLPGNNMNLTMIPRR